MTYLLVLGRQPELGLAELESRFGPNALSAVQNGIVQLETDVKPNFDHFGSVLKAMKLLTPLDNTDWGKISRYLQRTLPEHLDYIPDGKVTLGISVHGLRASSREIEATALSLKKIIKSTGRPARIVPNKEVVLNTAQVLHNKLTDPNGIELVLVRKGSSTLLSQTVWVQDIEAYRKRDQERPMRDARVGMLPPKLAQIIINLAVDSQASAGDTILDPFCGTGVVLQEAVLMGYKAYGTDLEERMVDYSRRNMEWLGMPAVIEQSDATSYKWRQPFDFIAGETYLGRPFSSEPDAEILHKVIHDANIIHKKFLQNVATQTKSGFRMCIAVPAWHTKNGVKHLPTLDHLEELGYNRVSFVHVSNEDLVYHREGQIVGRELLVLTRK